MPKHLFVIILAIACGFLILLAATVSESRAIVPATSLPVVKTSDPTSLFKTHCARCHGADGSADTESGRIYETPDISGGRLKSVPKERLERLVSKGKGSMPAFGKKLSASQIASLVSHMREL